MYISQSYIRSLNTNSILESISYLPYNPYSIDTIPLVESNNGYLLDIRDIVSYNESTNSDIGDIVYSICESNGIDVDDIRFIVEDVDMIESMYDDNGLYSLVEDMIDNGIRVELKSINENDEVYRVMEYLLENNILEDGIEVLLERVRSDVKKERRKKIFGRRENKMIMKKD